MIDSSRLASRQLWPICAAASKVATATPPGLPSSASGPRDRFARDERWRDRARRNSPARRYRRPANRCKSPGGRFLQCRGRQCRGPAPSALRPVAGPGQTRADLENQRICACCSEISLAMISAMRLKLVTSGAVAVDQSVGRDGNEANRRERGNAQRQPQLQIDERARGRPGTPVPVASSLPCTLHLAANVVGKKPRRGKIG